jgi:large subunit ribosomal protein L6
MSRVGRKPIPIPKGVEVKILDPRIRIKGPKGELEQAVHPQMSVESDGKELVVRRPSDETRLRALHGTARNQIMNMITGVTKGFEKGLEITGVGFRAAVQGRNLVLNLGFSHPVNFELPKGIDAQVEKQTAITLRGVDCYLVGQVASNIRRLRPPEPYKGKGIKYKDEKIRRKEGKTGK